MFENATVACGICSTAKICGGDGAEASSILVRHNYLMHPRLFTETLL